MNWNSISFWNETLKKCLGKLRNKSNSAAVNCLKLQDQLLTDRTTWNPGIYQKEESPVCWSPGFCVKRYRHKESSGYVRILRRHNILDFESRALTIRPSSSLSPIFFLIVLLVHFFTFRFWDDWAYMSEKMSKHLFQNHPFFRMLCAFWQHGWPLRLFKVSFEPTEDAKTGIIVPIKKLLNICR